MYAALKLRIDTANGIFSGTMKVETALQKLRTEASPSGLMLEPDADFAYAAIDLGQRLIASGRPDEAGKFFTEAEKALDQAVRKTPDSAARDKAQYLAKLSFLRSSYLNQVTQARLDLDQALALQPGDPKLKRAKDRLPNDPAEMLKKNPQG